MREGDTEGFGGKGRGMRGGRRGEEQWNMGGGVEVNSRNRRKRENGEEAVARDGQGQAMDRR